jgi:hypothetical protein
LGASQIGTCEFRIPKLDASQIHAAELGTAEVDSAQIQKAYMLLAPLVPLFYASGPET